MAQYNAQLVGTRSHHVTLDRFGQLDREEVYGDVEAVWRGERVTVKVTANRYRHSSGVSDWRIFIQDARYGDGDYGTKSLTDTARSRLREETTGELAGWIDSECYRSSFGRALVYALKLIVREPHYNAPDHLRQAIPKHVEFIGSLNADALFALADKAEAFATAYDELEAV